MATTASQEKGTHRFWRLIGGSRLERCVCWTGSFPREGERSIQRFGLSDNEKLDLQQTKTGSNRVYRSSRDGAIDPLTERGLLRRNLIYMSYRCNRSGSS